MRALGAIDKDDVIELALELAHRSSGLVAFGHGLLSNALCVRVELRVDPVEELYDLLYISADPAVLIEAQPAGSVVVYL